jgi:hypothetical protein
VLVTLSANRKGAIAETAIAAEATRLGFDVYRPIAEGGRYDLIIDTNARLVRVQCKWARLLANVVSVGLRTSRLSSHGYVRSTYDASEIDGVAAYCRSSSTEAGHRFTSDSSLRATVSDRL